MNINIKKIGVICLMIGLIALVLGVILLITADTGFSFGIIIGSIILNIIGINLMIAKNRN